MRYRSAHVGNFFLVEKEGAPEFTAEDEEVLVLFTAQAATVIANARTHRAEQRARADLEALVETSPVGVVVFEARTGHPVSLNREARRIVEGLRTAGRPAHMRGLISDLLDAGRIKAGTLSVKPEPSEVSDLVDRARNTFQSGGGRHPVLIDLPLDLPPVMADRRRIVQVLNNLLSNAARHSLESSPIRVAAMREGVHVAVSVSDEGRGVAPDLLPHLFRRYAGVAGRDGRRENGGAGLGLVICKGLVEAHGGRIQAESGGPGHGTRFTFTMPVTEQTRDSELVGAGRRPSSSHREPRAPARILVVDDDPQTLRYVRDALTASGYAPLVTGGDADLSHIIRTEKPHLVLLDLMLPGTDGIALMESVPELAELPVVFISGYGRDETIARALESGVGYRMPRPG